jgi:hypothetical protein
MPTMSFVKAMMTAAVGTSETSVNHYDTTLHNHQDSHLHTLRCENLKSHNMQYSWQFPRQVISWQSRLTVSIAIKLYIRAQNISAGLRPVLRSSVVCLSLPRTMYREQYLATDHKHVVQSPNMLTSHHPTHLSYAVETATLNSMLSSPSGTRTRQRVSTVRDVCQPMESRMTETWDARASHLRYSRRLLLLDIWVIFCSHISTDRQTLKLTCHVLSFIGYQLKSISIRSLPIVFAGYSWWTTFIHVL